MAKQTSAVRRDKNRAARSTGRQHSEDRLKWRPEVGRRGELFLRRREQPQSNKPGAMNYPFAQGLTFVARRWRNLMNEELRALGQSQARWGALYWIAVFGDTVNQTELADRIGVEQPTLGRVLMDLEKAGLIERRMVDTDKRAKVIRLTEAAKPVMRDINRIQGAMRTRLLEGIPPEDLRVCVSVFAKILANMDER